LDVCAFYPVVFRYRGPFTSTSEPGLAWSLGRHRQRRIQNVSSLRAPDIPKFKHTGYVLLVCMMNATILIFKLSYRGAGGHQSLTTCTCWEKRVKHESSAVGVEAALIWLLIRLIVVREMYSTGASMGYASATCLISICDQEVCSC
jgi:hypothetical protein